MSVHLSLEPAHPEPQTIVDSLPPNRPLPLRGAIIIKLAVAVSLIFIFTICFCFVGADVDEDYFKKSLTETANSSPGVVLLGESVDVDVDEPSITIRWSIIACGEGFFLPGSTGVHKSTVCGMPSQPLRIFVDNNLQPAATYDPAQIPLDRDTGSRRSIQNLVQFDSDHVLDVHEARVYPFDTYLLSSTLRAVSATNDTVPIRKLLTIDITSSFDIDTTDSETYSSSTSSAGTVTYTSRDIDMHVARPTSARIFALALFALNWIMAHVTVGLVLLCRRIHSNVRPIFKHLLSAGAILIAIPQMRNSMPDAPGFDDTIGYFPQMIIAGTSTISILLILIGHEIDHLREPPIVLNRPPRDLPSPPPSALNRIRPPPTPTKDSSSLQIAQYERHRAMQHMKGEYVFPPVNLLPSDPSVGSPHRRTKSTMPKISEGSGDSRFSDFL
ncbi:hypothetical protein DXG01_001904 [Tephrocybe rancida]|nr:hypothetical protein DXG01_001904 [Tephrocybe rancida]